MKKFVFPENKSVIDFRVMDEDAMEPGPGGAGAPPSCFGAAAAAATGTGIFGAADDALRRILRFFLDIYGNNSNTNMNTNMNTNTNTNTSNTIITIDYLSLSII